MWSVDYEFVECPDGFKPGPMRARFKDGTTKFDYNIQPENHNNIVTSTTLTYRYKVSNAKFSDWNVEDYFWPTITLSLDAKMISCIIIG